MTGKDGLSGFTLISVHTLRDKIAVTINYIRRRLLTTNETLSLLEKS